MTPPVDIVIVNWNSGELLKGLLNSLDKSSDSRLVNKIIIIDNNSTDQSLQFCKKQDVSDFNLNVEFILNKENLGFARSCNMGAERSNAPYLLFLNPDTLLSKNSIKAPLVFLEDENNSDYAVCGIKLLDEEENITRTSAKVPNFGNFLNSGLGLDKFAPTTFPGILNTEWDHSDSRDVDHVMGAFYFIRSNIFKELGGFDDQFFLYYEDLDLSARIKKSGYKIRYLADASAVHQGGGCSKQIKTLRLSFSYASKYLYIKKHFSWMLKLFLLFTLFIVEPIQRFFFYLFKSSTTETFHSLAGYGHFVYSLLLKSQDKQRRDRNIDITAHSSGIFLLGYSSMLVTLLTFLGRALSIYRDRLLALHLGASITVDNFFLLIGVSQLATNIFAASAINYYLPTLYDSKSSKRVHEINLRLSLSWAVVSFILIGLLQSFLNYSLIDTAITAFSFFFLSMNALYAAFLNRLGSFIKPTISFTIPILATVFPILFMGGSQTSLLASFLVGNMVQLVMLNSMLPKEDKLPTKVSSWFKTLTNSQTLEPWHIFVITWAPLVVATLHFPVTEILNIFLSKSFGAGSVSQMGYAMRIPVAIANIISNSVWAVLLPQIQIGGNLPGFKKSYLMFAFFLGLTSIFSVALLFFNPTIVNLIYGRGSSLSVHELKQVIEIQAIFIIAFPFQLFVNIFLRFLHSLRKTIPTLAISMVGISSMLIYFYQFDYSLVGVAKSFLVNSIVTSCLLIMYWLIQSFFEQRSARVSHAKASLATSGSMARSIDLKGRV